MSTISQNLQAVRESIIAAAHATARDPEHVSLLAVSKTFAADAVMEAVQAGQRAFGENYVQEAIEKIAVLKTATAQACPGAQLQWHFIGPIQSNKTRSIAEHFDWVHSVDRLQIAQRLSSQRPSALPALNICLQVNISAEASKSGSTVQEASGLAHAIAALPRLRLRGLMAVPEPALDVACQREPFRALRALFDALRAQGLDLDTLSMGMSADMAAAIAEGATIVRVGSAIFGQRQKATQ